MILVLVAGLVTGKDEDNNNNKGECDRTYSVGATTNSKDGTHVGAFTNPLSVIPGCTTTVTMAARQSFYMEVPGVGATNSGGARPVIHYGWSIDEENEETMIALFSFREQPTYRDGSTNYDWYWWPMLHSDVKVFQEDAQNIDYYHCHTECGYVQQGLQKTCGTCDATTDLRSQSDSLYVTLSTFPTEGTITVHVFIDLVFSNTFIAAPELELLKTMFSTMCEPYLYTNLTTTEEAEALDNFNERPDPERDFNNDEDEENDPRRRLVENDPRMKEHCTWVSKKEDIMGLTSNDCLGIPGVVCDYDGHVSDIVLQNTGLRGPLPADFGSVFGHLRHLELPDNGLNGSLPTKIFDSPNLERVDLSNNFFDGAIPCPSVDSPVTTVSLAKNFLQGDLGCLFPKMAKLTTLNLADNRLTGATIPVDIKNSPLHTLDLSNSGVEGTLDPLAALTQLQKLKVSYNDLTGDLTADFMAGLPELYTLDVSWNSLTGHLPVMANANLRTIDVSHNKFSGPLTTQFDEAFTAATAAGDVITLDMSANEFCGDLPRELYDMGGVVQNLKLSDNHFHCDVDNNKYFPPWALSLDFVGKCVPLPEMHAIANDDGSYWTWDSDTLVIDRDLETAAGIPIRVQGRFLATTTQGRCSFDYGGKGDPVFVPAIFASEEVTCMLPMGSPVSSQVDLTVAHYCDDFASLIGGRVSFSITDATAAPNVAPTSPPTSQPRTVTKKTQSSNTAVSATAVAGLALALVFFCILLVVLAKERQGNPVLGPDTSNPMFWVGSRKSMNDPGIEIEERNPRMASIDTVKDDDDSLYIQESTV